MNVHLFWVDLHYSTKKTGILSIIIQKKIKNKKDKELIEPVFIRFIKPY